MPPLKVHDVQVSYGKVRALRGVTLSVDERDHHRNSSGIGHLQRQRHQRGQDHDGDVHQGGKLHVPGDNKGSG